MTSKALIQAETVEDMLKNNLKYRSSELYKRTKDLSKSEQEFLSGFLDEKEGGRWSAAEALRHSYFDPFESLIEDYLKYVRPSEKNLFENSNMKQSNSMKYTNEIDKNLRGDVRLEIILEADLFSITRFILTNNFDIQCN